jgi:DNA polymerase/3'-5' exonuclease PolX
MSNEQIINVFKKLIAQLESDYLRVDMNGETKEASAIKFRIISLKKSLKIIQNYNKTIKKGSDISHIPGVGKGTIDRINEIIKTGTLEELRDDVDEIANSIKDLTSIINIGEKIAEKFVRDYDIKSVKELKKAIKNGKIEVNDKIALGLKYHDIVKGNIPRAEVTDMEKYVKKIAYGINKDIIVKVCGSYRRGKSTSNDIDVVIFHPKYKTRDYIKNSNSYSLDKLLVTLVDTLYDKGFLLEHLTDKNYITSYKGICQYKKNPARRIDITFSPYLSAPAALLHHTGPFELNEHMRNIAKSKNMLLNQYGLFKKKGDDMVMLKAKKESDIFDYLGIEYLTPVEREGYSAGSNKKF